MDSKLFANTKCGFKHPRLHRREALQVGAIGLLGLGMNHFAGLQSAHAVPGAVSHPFPFGRAKACIFVFLSGGLAQHDSFDMKPEAPESIRGEFRPIPTRTPGIQICEHLPMLADRSNLWALCRSLTHASNDHSVSHHMMLTGHSQTPTGFNPNQPGPADRPSIAAVAGRIAGQQTTPKNNLPTAIVVPERLIHSTGRVLPGQFAGEMGSRHDPWFIEAAPFHNSAYGAFPEYGFDHQDRGNPDQRLFQTPRLTVPDGLGMQELAGRLQLLDTLNEQRKQLAHFAETENFDRFRTGAVSLLTDSKIQQALNVTQADEKTQERYGKNSFGWSMLMARRLVASGVTLVQVNLGNDETWDTHGNAFPHLKNNLFPPTDRALSALLDDLSQSGQLDETLVVVAGEFGRTPKITLLEQHYKLPGRDHWGAAQSILLAGGGVRGGNVVGSTDPHGAFPTNTPVKPENFAATIYHALGIPATASWLDALDRPHHVYHGEPIPDLG
jgi:hypothetical protein